LSRVDLYNMAFTDDLLSRVDLYKRAFTDDLLSRVTYIIGPSQMICFLG